MATSTRPNILFIVVDDCGYADLSCCGQSDDATPALDRMAAEGVGCRLAQFAPAEPRAV